MIEFSSLDELSCIKGSEPLIEKIEGLQAFMRKNGMASSIKPYQKIKIDCAEKRLSFDLAISIPFQPSLSHLPLSSRLPSRQLPRKPQTFLDSFLNSIPH